MRRIDRRRSIRAKLARRSDRCACRQEMVEARANEREELDGGTPVAPFEGLRA
jgi:hypothetical protein